ncbi:MAG: proline dehydrogenase family protein [Candidatus Bipolaricaulia bacterium]
MLRNLLIRLSQSQRARRWISSFPPSRRVARRFIAGETLDEAIETVRQLNDRGLSVTLNHLGEHTESAEDAHRTASEYVELLDRIAAASLDANISVKPNQMGLDVDEDVCFEAIRTVAEHAQSLGNSVRVDMEGSDTVDATLRVYERLREAGFDNVGVVVQAYLFRSQSDVERLIERGANVRLCKGAYAEPQSVAFPDKGDVDANFRSLVSMMWQPEALDRETYVAVATHDEQLIRWCEDHVQTNGIPPNRFEFQVLYGVRRDLQRELAEKGYRVRVYVSYGTEWYPFFMRRLAERPANIVFIARQLLRS